jgi:hypothetical protein
MPSARFAARSDRGCAFELRADARDVTETSRVVPSRRADRVDEAFDLVVVETSPGDESTLALAMLPAVGAAGGGAAAAGASPGVALDGVAAWSVGGEPVVASGAGAVRSGDVAAAGATTSGAAASGAARLSGVVRGATLRIAMPNTATKPTATRIFLLDCDSSISHSR